MTTNSLDTGGIMFFILKRDGRGVESRREGLKKNL